jgi:hypothetical protein
MTTRNCRCQRRRVPQVIFAGAAAIAMLALVDAALLGTGETTVASGSVRLVDQATDLPAPPPNVPDEVAGLIRSGSPVRSMQRVV